MTRVLHLISGLSTGGTEMMLYRLLRGMDRGAFPSSVVTLTKPGPVAELIRKLGVPVSSLDMLPGVPNPIALWKLHGILRRVRPDVLQTWLYHSDLLGLIGGRLAGVPAIAWNVRCSVTDARYASGLRGATVRILAWLSGLPSVVVSNSAAGIDLHIRLGYRPQRWELIPNGFEVERFSPDAAARDTVRADLGLPADTPLVGLIARHDPLKDHETFLRAAAEVALRNESVHFMLAGTRVDWSNAELGRLIQELDLPRRVHLLGERSDVPRLTAALDIATCSSIGEGFANVIGEAMSCAVPVVSTDTGDARIVIADTGVVVPSRRPSALAEGIMALLNMDIAARRALGARGRERVKAQYDLRVVARRYATLYESLGSSAARPGAPTAQ